MSSVFFRGDHRNFEDVSKDGFKPRIISARNRTPEEAIAYIKKIIIGNNFKKPIDFSNYIISDSKGDSVSASFVLDGASYGARKYKITYRSECLFFEFNNDGSVGKQIYGRLSNVGGKPYYVLTNSNIMLSEYVIVGSRTYTQEATFFTDVPGNLISLIS